MKWIVGVLVGIGSALVAIGVAQLAEDLSRNQAYDPISHCR